MVAETAAVDRYPGRAPCLGLRTPRLVPLKLVAREKALDSRRIARAHFQSLGQGGASDLLPTWKRKRHGQIWWCSLEMTALARTWSAPRDRHHARRPSHLSLSDRGRESPGLHPSDGPVLILVHDVAPRSPRGGPKSASSIGASGRSHGSLVGRDSSISRAASGMTPRAKGFSGTPRD